MNPLQQIIEEMEDEFSIVLDKLLYPEPIPKEVYTRLKGYLKTIEKHIKELTLLLNTERSKNGEKCDK